MKNIFKKTALLAFVFMLPGIEMAKAQEQWPSRPITLVVPYSPGGYSDSRMRLLGRSLSKKLGQPVIVDNRPGASGVIGTASVARSAPDGYTIGTASFAPLVINPILTKKVPYDPVNDFIQVIMIEQSPLVLSVNNNLPVKNVSELIALAKKEPGRLTYGSSGLGGAHHLAGELFAYNTDIKITHVPYKGGSPAAMDLMAGHLSMMFELGYAAIPSIKDNKIRPLAVSSTKRLALLPNVPTMAEAGIKGFEAYNWQGILVPAKTPEAIVTKLNKAFNEILKEPEVASAIVANASQALGGTPQDAVKYIDAERVKWAKVIKEANITGE